MTAYVQLIAKDLPDFYLATIRGNVFTAVTLITGGAPGTEIGTTAPFTLHNPRGSSVNLVILRASMGYVSGTLGSGCIFYGANVDPLAAAVTGTLLTPSNDFRTTPGAGLAYVNATLPAVPTVMPPFCSLGALTAASAVTPWAVTDELGGSIIITPGCALSLQGVTAAGSAPLVIFALTWQEVGLAS